MFRIRTGPQTAALFLCLLVLSNQSSAQSENVFDPDTLCPLLAYGTKIKDPRKCTVYIECMGDEWESHSCGDQFYDHNTGDCVDPGTIECLSSDPCAKIGKSKGFVTDPYSCSTYYYCDNGVGSRGFCSDGLNFNPSTENCVRNYPCEITMIPEDYCNIVPEAVFIKEPDSCRDYQLCWKEKLINGSCPSGLFFNPHRGGCDDPKNVNCEEPKPELPEWVKCTEPETFIADGVNCDGYYYCGLDSEGEFEMIHGYCPVGRFFHPDEGGQCLPRSDIKCAYNRCATYGYDHIQMANIDGDGCTGFSICQHGKEIARAECPNGQYFNEWTQFCVDEEVTYAACGTTTTTTPTITPSTTIA